MKQASNRVGRRPREAEAAQSSLLDAARATFVEKGLHGLSLRDVAERAGCTTMAVYTRFGGKQGLVQALYDEGFARLRDAQAAVDGALPAAERVVALCLAYRATALAFPHHYALMLGRTSGNFEPSPASREGSLATFEVLVSAVAGLLPRARSAALHRERSTGLALRVFAFCHGWMSLELTDRVPGSPADRRVSFEAGVRALLPQT